MSLDPKSLGGSEANTLAPTIQDEKDKKSAEGERSQEGSGENHIIDIDPTEKGVQKGVEGDKDASDKKGKKKKKAKGKKDPNAPDPVGFFKLFRYSTKLEITLDIFGVFCAAASGAAQPLMTLIFGKLTATFVSFQNVKTAADLVVARSLLKTQAAKDASYLVAIGAGMLVVTYIYMLIWVWTGEVNSKRIREKYLKSVLRQDVAFFDTLGAGEVATRIQSDTHLIQEGISEKVALVVSYLATFFTGFILAYVRSPRLAGALTSILPCIACTGAVMTSFMVKYKETGLNHIAASGSLAEEVISTIRTAQVFGSQEQLSTRFNHHIDASAAVGRKGGIVTACGLGTMFFVIYSAYALAFVYGAILISQGRANAGIVVNVFLSILIGSFSLAMLAPEIQAISNARGAAAKLFQTMDRVPSIDSESDEGTKLDNVVGEITFEGVKFEYPSRPGVPILKGLTTTFPAGQTVALVGSSGSGKSTVVALVERFYDPAAGTIKLDGVDIKSLNVRWLRQQIGLVSQEPVLFACTVAENVAYGLIGSKYESANDEEKMVLIKAACVKSNADGFITSLPEGYDTVVGERGMLLSGGQKQRVAIARAIVSDPRILLLDEATSALDSKSEGVVQDALDKAAAGRTTITIAHRLSTIKDANKILVMGGGEILEAGNHNELLESNGAYATLINAQKFDAEKEGAEDAEVLEDGTVEPENGLISSKEAEAIAANEKVDLHRTQTGQSGVSLSSQVLKARGPHIEEKFKSLSYVYLARRMLRINQENRNLYIIGLCASVCGGCVYPAFGILYGFAVSNFSEQNFTLLKEHSNRWALYFFVMAILAAIAIGIQNVTLVTASENLTSKLRKLTFKAYLRQDVGWFDEEKNSTGALTSNLSDWPTKISGLAGVTLGTLLQSCATIIAGAIVGLIYSWKIALIGIACTPFIVSAGYIRLRVVVLKDQQNKLLHESSAQLACEAAGAIRTVASLTREKSSCELYSKALEEPLKKSNRTSIYSTALFAVSQSLSFWVIALVFWAGSIFIADGGLAINHFFTALMSVVFGAIQAGNVFAFVPDMSAAGSSASAIIRLLDQWPEIDAESDEGIHLEPTQVQGHIKFNNVHFRYPTRPGVRVLRNLNLDIKPGQYVALVGPSGCGKSTTIQLTSRFYDPLSGNVTLDGTPINELNVQSYRRSMALVSQEPTLYAGTVKFNILLGAVKPHEEVTQEEIEHACRQSNILDFIQSLPDGFDTEVGGKGAQLSGGQKQRIAIARALLRNPKILLLDESTSALDSTSEKVVQAALDNAAKGRTTIAIAHRLSTIQHADCIYFFKEGRVAEAGTHQELMALKGGYFELVQMQALSKNE